MNILYTSFFALKGESQNNILKYFVQIELVKLNFININKDKYYLYLSIFNR